MYLDSMLPEMPLDGHAELFKQRLLESLLQEIFLMVKNLAIRS